MNTTIKIKDIEQNTGQVAGLPANPRQWTRDDIERLARSIEETPELLDARPLIVIPHAGKYVVLGGNLRLAALKKLGRAEAPAYILPEETPLEKQREIVIKDNGSFGAWDYDALANEWDNLPLDDWGVPAWDPVKVDEGAVDALFEEQGGGLASEPLKVQVLVPASLEDKLTDILAALKVTLEEWPGCLVK